MPQTSWAFLLPRQRVEAAQKERARETVGPGLPVTLLPTCSVTQSERILLGPILRVQDVIHPEDWAWCEDLALGRYSVTTVFL